MICIDVKGRKILYQLDTNARQSFSQIGKKVGLPKTVVSYRVKKMQKNGIINSFYTVIDTFKLGYSSFRIYLGFQYISPEIEKEIIDHFAKNRLNWWIISADGRFNLAVIMWVKEVSEFYTFWEDTLKKYRDFFRVQQFSVYIQSQEFLKDFLLTSDQTKDRYEYVVNGTTTNKNLDEIDMHLLKLIANNARIPIGELSMNLNISFNAVKQRIKRLMKLGIILGFRVDINYKKLGYEFYKADIELIDYKDRSKIITYVKMNPHLIRIDKSIGISDLELEFHVKDHDQFQNIIADLQKNFKDTIRNYKYLTAKDVHTMNHFPLG
jgi:DNA-binding Lrp family transcriptional regulator